LIEKNNPTKKQITNVLSFFVMARVLFIDIYWTLAPFSYASIPGIWEVIASNEPIFTTPKLVTKASKRRSIADFADVTIVPGDKNCPENFGDAALNSRFS
jgi:hypothetical protein